MNNISGFPKAITDFVRGHVSAKRYLVAKKHGYYDRKYLKPISLFDPNLFDPLSKNQLRQVSLKRAKTTSTSMIQDSRIVPKCE